MRLEKFLTESINDKGIWKAVFMGGSPGSGKAQPLYSMVKTPDSWISMGDIGVGQKILCPDNTITEVIQIHYQGIKDIYRVYLNGGRYTDCTLEHLWNVRGYNVKVKVKTDDKKLIKRTIWQTRNLKWIMERLEMKSYKNRFFLPNNIPVEFSKKELLIDPYVMGILIGDGCLKQRISFTNIDKQIIEGVKNRIPGYHLKQYKHNYFISYNKRIGPNKTNYRKELEKLGLWGLYSYEKFIPEIYKNTSIEDRYALIRGLMDSDGYVDKKGGHIQFYTTSKRLANDFREVIWSLGGNTLIKKGRGMYKNVDGSMIKCKEYYSITIMHRKPESLFGLDRKVKRAKNQKYYRNTNNNLRNRIEKIEYIGKHEAMCITIDHPDGLYITNNYIVTHNSYVMDKIKSGQVEPRIVNTDKSFPLFKKYWNEEWGKIKVKVKTITKNQLSLYINSMLPLVIDGTANKTSVILKRAGILESFGYDVAMVFINTSLETSLKRAGLREREVDSEVIKKIYDEVEKAKNFYRSRFNTFLEIDNDEGELNDAAIIHSFKFMSNFYNGTLLNPVGIDYRNRMIENGWKYLSPNIRSLEEIKKTVGIWYKR